jgi:hypothetical protein
MLSKRGMTILLFLYALMRSICRASGESIVRIGMARRSGVGSLCFTSDVATWINNLSEAPAAELGALLWTIDSSVAFRCWAAVCAAAAMWCSATALLASSA